MATDQLRQPGRRSRRARPPHLIDATVSVSHDFGIEIDGFRASGI
jgi:hypothetical protein